jgi:hypothetical protein
MREETEQKEGSKWQSKQWVFRKGVLKWAMKKRGADSEELSRRCGRCASGGVVGAEACEAIQ